MKNIIRNTNSNELETKTFDEVFQITDGDRGKNYPSKVELFNQGACVFLNAKNVSKTGLTLDHISEWITEDKDKLLRKGVVKDNDIILTTRGTIGNIGFNDPLLKFPRMRINSGMVILTPLSNIFPKYAYYLLRSEQMKKSIKNLQSGGVLKQLPVGSIKQMKFHFHNDIKEQEKIANFLSERESYLQSIQTLISKMEQRNQYYFDKIFLGDYEVHGQDIVFIDDSEKGKINLNRKEIEVNSRFSKKKIPQMISLKKGGSVKKEDFNYEGDGVQYLRTSDVWEESSSKKEEVYYNGDMKGLVYKTKSDWIVCFDGYNRKPKRGTLGLVTNKGEGYCSGELHIVKGMEGISREFVNIALLKSSYFQDLICRYGEGTTVKHAGKHVKTIELPYIPYEEQVVLDTFIRKVLGEIDLLKELYSKEKQVFQWLCEKLVSGDYRIED